MIVVGIKDVGSDSAVVDVGWVRGPVRCHLLGVDRWNGGCSASNRPTLLVDRRCGHVVWGDGDQSVRTTTTRSVPLSRRSTSIRRRTRSR